MLPQIFGELVCSIKSLENWYVASNLNGCTIKFDSHCIAFVGQFYLTLCHKSKFGIHFHVKPKQGQQTLRLNYFGYWIQKESFNKALNREN